MDAGGRAARWRDLAMTKRLSRFVREALLGAYRVESVLGAEAVEKMDDELPRRVDVTEAQLADALGALARERERVDPLGAPTGDRGGAAIR